MSASEFEGHEAVIAALRAGTLGAPDHLRRRVLAGAPAKRRGWTQMSRRRQALVLIPVAATLAMGAAVVKAAFFAGSTQAKAAPVFHRSLRPAFAPNGVAGLPGPTGPKGPTGATGATGANGATGATGATAHGGLAFREAGRRAGVVGGPGPTGPKGPGASTGTTSAWGSTGSFDYQASAPLAAGAQKRLDTLNGTSVVIPKGRLVHATAYLTVGVSSVSALTHATNEATQIVTGLGGYTQNSQINASSKNYGRAYLDLRVPLARTQTAIDKLDHLGHVLSQSLSTQDLEQQAKRETSQIGQLQRAIEIYKQALSSGTLSPTERVDIQVKLSNAEHEIAGTRKQHSATVKSGTTAEIRMSLSTTHQGAAVVRHHKTGRLGQLLHNMGNFLGWEGIIVLYVLVVAVPILLIGGLAWWIIRERRKREEELLAANA